MFDFVKDTLQGFADAAYIRYEQNKPELLIYSGVAGLIVAGVAACVATVKTKDILDETKEKLDVVKKMAEEGKTPDGEVFTEEDANKEIAYISRKAVLKIVCGFVFPVVTAIVSVASIKAGVDEGERRINKLGAELALATAKIDKILDRAEKAYGPDAKDKLLYDIHKEKAEETIVDEKTGKEKVKKTEKTVAGEDISDGVRVVINKYNCPSWFRIGDWEYNLSQLKVFEKALESSIYKKHNAFGGALMTADEVMHQLEWHPAEETEWRLQHKDYGWVSTPDNPVTVDLGLKEAERLIQYGICDESEIVLHINFQNNIWAKAKG